MSTHTIIVQGNPQVIHFPIDALSGIELCEDSSGVKLLDYSDYLKIIKTLFQDKSGPGGHLNDYSAYQKYINRTNNTEVNSSLDQKKISFLKGVVKEDKIDQEYNGNLEKVARYVNELTKSDRKIN